MPIAGSGQLDMYSIRNYTYGPYGWGNLGNGGGYSESGPYPTLGAYDLGFYLGRWHRTTGGALTRFSTDTLGMNQFYGKSPGDEWNCACACEGACA